MTKAAALVSEGGSKLQALIDCVYFDEIPDFELTVISSDPKAYALARAKNAGLPCYVVEEAIFPNGASFALALLNKLRDLDIDLIILSDFSPALGEGTARLYSGRAIGVRPALVPAFDGIRDSAVCAAAIERGIRITGATSYYANDSGGVGPIIRQIAVDVSTDDDAGTLRRRIMEEAERKLLQEAVMLHCTGKLEIENGHVKIL
ncbi:MAG: phosphoribosylglycinamide formyltransferase [Clostridia bacterium]|nr:phosphoribosylglycinamide formyltransferase [Clostridia bacterium]NCC67934.1 phosphoribosylglycinamide formyltransferase [Clostridia bacterium]